MSKVVDPKNMSKFDREYLQARGIDPDEYAARFAGEDETPAGESNQAQPVTESEQGIVSDGTNESRGGELPTDLAGDGDDAADEDEPDLTGQVADEDDDEDVPYSAWNNDELRTELKNRGLSTEGKKAELIARLEADDADDSDEDEA